MAKTPVTAADVRTWASENGALPEGQKRGRIPASVTDAYNKANPRNKFAGSPRKSEG